MAPGRIGYQNTPSSSTRKTKSQIMNQPGVLKQSQELYWRYKTSTTIVLKYLYATAHKCKFAFINGSSMTREEMIQSAKAIAVCKIKPQQEILWALQASIAGRIEMSKLYRTAPELQGDEESDKNHKYFVNVLGKVQKILFAGPQKTKATPEKSDSVHRVVEDMEDLEIEEEIEDGDEDENGSPSVRLYGRKGINPDALASFLAKMDAEHQADESHAHAPNDISVSDDQISDRFMHMMEANAVLKEMQDTRAMTDIWDTYREGKLPLFNAAYLTHHIYETKCYFFRRFAKRTTLNGVETLIDRADGIRATVQRCADDLPGVLEEAFLVSDGLRETLETVQDYRSLTDEQKSQLVPNSIINPRKFVPPAWDYDESDDSKDDIKITRRRALLKMIGDTCRDVSAEEDFINHIIGKQTCRCCGDGYTGGFLRHHSLEIFSDNISDGVEFSALSGLSWSVNQYHRHLHGADEESNNAAVKQQPNLRVQVLRFAQEVSNAIKTCLFMLEQNFDSSQERNVHSTEYLRKIQSSLDGFLSTKRFDLYSQAPWVAGFHLLGLWMFAMSNGVMVCNESAFVAAVLHIYNAAVEVGFLSKSSMPVLEALCETLKEPFFRGKRPEFNFISHYCTVVGGGFQGRKETEHKKRLIRAKAAMTGKDMSWELKAAEADRNRRVLPTHLPCINSECDLNPEYKFLSASTLSATFQTAAEDGFRPRFDMLAQLKGYGKGAAAKRRAKDEYWDYEYRSLSKIGSGKTSIVDENETNLLRDTLQSEFSAGELPAPRVNWFLVFKLYAGVIGALADVDCADRRSRLPKSFCGAGVGVKLLHQLEDMARGQKDSINQQYWRVAKKAMEGAFMGLTPEDLLWQHLSSSSS